MEIEQIASLLLPEGILRHFRVVMLTESTNLKSKKGEYRIYLDELNQCPSGYESKGFMESKEIQDFPVRGKTLILIIRRRRWRHKNNPKDIIKSDYKFIAQGVKLTAELADFLKG